MPSYPPDEVQVTTRALRALAIELQPMFDEATCEGLVAAAAMLEALQAEVERLSGKFRERRDECDAITRHADTLQAKLGEENATHCEQEQILREKASYFSAKLDRAMEVVEAAITLSSAPGNSLFWFNLNAALSRLDSEAPDAKEGRNGKD